MLPTYLSIEAARTRIAELPSAFGRLAALSDAALLQQVTIATLRVDASGPYTGCRAAIDQVLEFPRTGQDAVPDAVELAVLYEAEWMLDPARKRAATALAAGVASQSTGGLSVSYASQAATSLLESPLSEMSRLLLAQYVRRLGEVL